MNTLLFISTHLLVSGLPVIAALWGMVLAINWYEWTRYWALVHGARCAPARGGTWVTVHFAGGDEVQRVHCQEYVLRRYQAHPPKGCRQQTEPGPWPGTHARWLKRPGRWDETWRERP